VRLRREPIFVDQPAEQVAAADVVEVDHLADRVLAWRRQGMERWPLAKCAVRPVLVVMRDVRREGALEVAPAEDQQSIETLAAEGPDPAFACARAFGARTGALIKRMPSERKISSNSRGNLLSRSRTRNSGRTSSSESPRPCSLPA
jgi:hypothetical protein